MDKRPENQGQIPPKNVIQENMGFAEAESAQQRVGFLDLPPDVRNMVYTTYFDLTLKREHFLPYSWQHEPQETFLHDYSFLAPTKHRNPKSRRVRDTERISQCVPDRSWVVVDPYGYLISRRSAPLTLTCRTVFKETWHWGHDLRELKYCIFALNGEMDRFFQSRIWKLLEEVGARLTEANTEVYIATRPVPKGRYVPSTTEWSWWLENHWNKDTPLFMSMKTDQFFDKSEDYLKVTWVGFVSMIARSRMLFEANPEEWFSFTHTAIRKMFSPPRKDGYNDLPMSPDEPGAGEKLLEELLRRIFYGRYMGRDYNVALVEQYEDALINHVGITRFREIKYEFDNLPLNTKKGPGS